MKKPVLSTLGIVAALFVGGMTGSQANAAIPPLSLAELREKADVIFTGTVDEVIQETVEYQSGIYTFQDRRFIIVVNVKNAEKGAVTDKMAVTTWKPERRPDGFAGPQGQNAIPEKGDAARFYCVKADNKLKVLEPNGILPLGGGKDKGKNQPK